MTITALGSITIGDSVPGTLDALLAASADLNQRIAAYADFRVAVVPPSLAADIALCESLLVGLQLNFTLGIQPPSIALQFELMATALALLQAQLQIIKDLFGLFGTAGLHLYRYAGAVNAFGGELATELASGLPGGAGGDAANALVLITTIPATWAVMAQVFKVA